MPEGDKGRLVELECAPWLLFLQPPQSRGFQRFLTKPKVIMQIKRVVLQGWEWDSVPVALRPHSQAEGSPEVNHIYHLTMNFCATKWVRKH